jgi:hypothetical protein
MAAAAVADVPLDVAQDHLRKLYALSLVQVGRAARAGQPNRYRLHLLLRDYAGQQLGEDTAVTPRFV